MASEKKRGRGRKVSRMGENTVPFVPNYKGMPNHDGPEGRMYSPMEWVGVRGKEGGDRNWASDL